MVLQNALRKPLGLSILILTLISLSGCATGMFLPKVGNRAEQLTDIDRVVSNGQEIVLFYRVAVYAGTLTVVDGEVESGVSKWSRLDLQTVELRPLVWRGVTASKESQLNIEDGERPALDSSYKDVPVLFIPAENRIQNEKYVQSLAATGEPYELSIHVPTNPPGPIHSYLTLVDNRKRDSGPPKYNDRIRPPMREYQAWWAVPARLVLAPVAIATDILLSPFYLTCLALGCKT